MSLPRSDCQSKLPSPVTTTSASSRAASRPVSSRTRPAPDVTVAPEERSAAPRPPAAPAPGISDYRFEDVHGGELRFEAFDGFRGRALLRAERARGAVRAEQRVLHVGRGDERYISQVDAGVGPTRRGGEHAGAAVGRAGAAEADRDDIVVSRRCRDELADASRCRRLAGLRAELGRDRGGGRTPRRTRCRRRVAVVHASQRASTGFAERARDADVLDITAEGGVQDVDEAGAAVGQRALDDDVVGLGVAPAGGDGVSGLAGGQGAAEAVRSDEYAHLAKGTEEPLSYPGVVRFLRRNSADTDATVTDVDRRGGESTRQGPLLGQGQAHAQAA